MDDYNSKFTGPEIDAAIDRAKAGGAIDKALQNKADTSSVYTKTESDTLLAGKAPAGYGLGMNSNSSIYDADNITAFGFYTAKTNTPTNNWCTILNIPYGQNRATQFSTLGEAVSADKYSYCKREKIDGIWKPWEWVNPRMSFGVEYRTTERYQGKPVYVKLVNFGVLPNNTSKSVAHGITELATVLYVNGTIGYGTLLADPNVSGITLDNTNITITTTADMSGFASNVILKYYKYTD